MTNQEPPAQNRIPEPEKKASLPPEVDQAAIAANPNLAALMQVLSAGSPYGIPPAGAQLSLPLGLAQQTVQMWQGPHVPPEAAEKYETVLPGSFDRMLALTEQIQAAQITSSATAIQYLRDDVKRGHWLGFSVSIVAMLGALACVKMGSPSVAWAFLSVPVMAVGKALIDSSRAKSPTLLANAINSQQLVAPRPSQPPRGRGSS